MTAVIEVRVESIRPWEESDRPMGGTQIHTNNYTNKYIQTNANQYTNTDKIKNTTQRQILSACN